MSEETIITIIPFDKNRAIHHRDNARHYMELSLKYRNNAMIAWLEFYKAAQCLQDAGAHKKLGMTWQRYCRDELDVSDSHIRQMRRVYETALAIEKDCGILPTEWHLRKMPKHLKDSDPQLLSAIYQSALKLSGGQAPSKSQYKIAEEVIQGVISHEGQVDIGNGMTNFDAALEQADYETIMRQRAHIANGCKYRTTARYDVTAAGLRQRLRSSHYPIRKRLRVNAPARSQHMLLLIREEKS
jgi:hypothetical protein